MFTQSDHPIINAVSQNLATTLQVDAKNITFGTGMHHMGDGLVVGDAREAVEFQIKVRDPLVEVAPFQAEAFMAAKLEQNPALKGVVQFANDDQVAAQTKEQLTALAVGNGVDPRHLQWRGFQPERKGSGEGVEDHGCTMRNDAYGVEVRIAVPSDGVHDNAALVQQVEKNIEARLPAIKQNIMERTAAQVTQDLQQQGKNPQEIQTEVAQVMAQMQQMKVAIKGSAEKYGNDVTITMRSPQQAEAYEKAADKLATPDNADALKASNPLSRLSDFVPDAVLAANPDASPPFQKILGKAVLHVGEKAEEIFPLVAGRKDMKMALKDELQKIVAAQPEKAAAAEQILASPVFKIHNQFMSQENKADLVNRATFSKSADEPNVMAIRFSVPKEKFERVLMGLAGVPQTQPSTVNVTPVAAMPMIATPAQQVAVTANDQSWVGALAAQPPVANGARQMGH